MGWKDNSDNENQFLIQIISQNANDPIQNVLLDSSPWIVDANTENYELYLPTPTFFGVQSYNVSFSIQACNGRQDTTFECSSPSNLLKMSMSA